jgi:hypothetical protein
MLLPVFGTLHHVEVRILFGVCDARLSSDLFFILGVDDTPVIFKTGHRLVTETTIVRVTKIERTPCKSTVDYIL